VVWYQGQFQALNFLTVYLRTDYVSAYTAVLIAVALATPFFIFFGWLSDKIGRKPIILGGCLLAALTYVPIYQAMIAAGNPIYGPDGKIVGANPNVIALAGLIFIQVIFVTMVYGPIAAFLVEYFPGRLRYTLLSIPYHLGNGEFGGWLPFIYTGLVAATVVGTGYQPFFGLNLQFLNPSGDPNGNILAGLIYTITVAVMTVIVGWFFIRESKDTKIWEEVGGEKPDDARVGALVS
jgi:MFS family permease